jgi:hypothetical protein
MNSKPISPFLEREHPSPPLHLEYPTLPKVELLLAKVMAILRGIWMLEVYMKLLSERLYEVVSYNQG